MTSSTRPAPASPTTRAATPKRDALLRDLNSLTLPMMWMLRQRSVRTLEPLGLRPIKALVLGLIAEGPCAPSELTELVDTAPSMMSSLIADLEERGLIARNPDPEDRRKIQLSVTKKGQALMQELDTVWLSSAHEQLGHLSDEELATLATLHKKILRSAS